MTTFVENRIINLNANSATQKNGDFLSSVYFQFNGLLKDNPDIQAVYISVQNAQFPYSFYNINVYNNVLVVSDDGNPPVTLTLTRGNYNATTLIAELLLQLSNAGINHITITISSITGLLTFTCQNNHTLELFSAGSTLLRVLGFNPALNYTSVASVIVAPYPLNLLGTLKMRVASYDLPVSSIDSSVGGNLNILATIPINAGNFGLIMYENTNNIQNSLDIRTLDGFDLEIIDDDGNYINFNAAYWTITMMLSVERRLPEVSPTTFADITSAAAAMPPPMLPPEIPEEELIQSVGEGDDLAIYAEAPDVEVAADDLDLLLFGAGIR